MFFPEHEFVVIEPHFPMDDCTVAMDWSQRFENEPANRWLRQVSVELPRVSHSGRDLTAEGWPPAVSRSAPA